MTMQPDEERNALDKDITEAIDALKPCLEKFVAAPNNAYLSVVVVRARSFYNVARSDVRQELRDANEGEQFEDPSEAVLVENFLPWVLNFVPKMDDQEACQAVKERISDALRKELLKFEIAVKQSEEQMTLEQRLAMLRNPSSLDEAWDNLCTIEARRWDYQENAARQKLHAYLHEYAFRALAGMKGGHARIIAELKFMVDGREVHPTVVRRYGDMATRTIGILVPDPVFKPYLQYRSVWIEARRERLREKSKRKAEKHRRLAAENSAALDILTQRLLKMKDGEL